MCKLLLHQLFMHFLLLLHLLGRHADFVVQRLDFRQLPGRLQLDGDETGTIQRLSEFGSNSQPSTSAWMPAAFCPSVLATCETTMKLNLISSKLCHLYRL